MSGLSNEESLSYSIIDREKRENTSKMKQIVLGGSVLFVFAIIKILNLVDLQYTDDLLRDDGLPSNITYFPVIAFLLISVVVPIAFVYAFKSPSRGKIEFHDRVIVVILGKTKTEFLTTDVTITLYEFPSFDLGMNYYLKLVAHTKTIKCELDIVFTKEKEDLELLKCRWKDERISFTVKKSKSMPVSF